MVNMFTHTDHSKKYIFYGNVLSRCKIIFCEELEAPAAIHFDIDKYVLTINLELFSKYSVLLRMGILKHEALHILHKHIERFSAIGYNTLVNFACDCSINQLIIKEHLPENHITVEFLSELCGNDLLYNESAEYYYNAIKHLSDESEQYDKDSKSQWDESNILDENTIDHFTDKLVDEAISDTVKMNGRVPILDKTSLSIKVESGIDWKREVRKVISTQKQGKVRTNKKPSRRFPNRDDVQGVKKDNRFNLLIILDVSSSVSNKESIELMGNIKSIHSQCSKLSKMTVIQVDTVAYSPEEFTPKTKVFTRKGKGGTNLYPAIERAKSDNVQYDGVIVLTDGYLFKDDVKNFENDKYNIPIIWMISKNGCKTDNFLYGSTSRNFTIIRL